MSYVIDRIVFAEVCIPIVCKQHTKYSFVFSFPVRNVCFFFVLFCFYVKEVFKYMKIGCSLKRFLALYITLDGRKFWRNA